MRGRCGALRLGQALLDQRAAGAVCGGAVAIRAVLIRPADLLQALVLRTPQDALVVPHKRVGMKDPGSSGAAAHRDGAPDAVRFEILMDRVPVKGAIQPQPEGIPVESGVILLQRADDRGRLGGGERHHGDGGDDATFGIHQKAAAVAAQRPRRPRVPHRGLSGSPNAWGNAGTRVCAA